MKKNEAFLYGVILEKGHISDNIQIITDDDDTVEQLSEFYEDDPSEINHIVIDDDEMIEKLSVSVDEVDDELIPQVICGIYTACGDNEDGKLSFNTNLSKWLSDKIEENVGEIEYELESGIRDKLSYEGTSAEAVLDWLCMNCGNCEEESVELDFNADLRELNDNQLEQLQEKVYDNFERDEKDKFYNLKNRLENEFDRRDMEVKDMGKLEQLQSESHRPEYESTSEGDWSAPDLEDFPNDYFDEDDEPIWEDIDDHFLIAKDGFPPEKYSELALPVVDENKTLYLSALQNAKARVGQVDGVSDEVRKEAEEYINTLAMDAFDEDWTEQESELSKKLKDSGIPFEER